MPAGDLQTWKIGLEAFKLKTQKQVVQMIKAIAFEMYKRILQKTPVDKGFLRGAWTVSLETPSDANSARMRILSKLKFAGDKPRLSPNPTGEEIGQFETKLSQINVIGSIQTIWFSNAMPYVTTVEFGGYPNPPKKGSWVALRKGRSGRRVKGTGQWVIKSVGGFSKQAPTGMVGVSLLEVINYIQTQAAKFARS